MKDLGGCKVATLLIALQADRNMRNLAFNFSLAKYTFQLNFSFSALLQECVTLSHSAQPPQKKTNKQTNKKQTNTTTNNKKQQKQQQQTNKRVVVMEVVYI